jgi:hypothetical protein
MLEIVDATVAHQPEHIGIDMLYRRNVVIDFPQVEKRVMQQILGIRFACNKVACKTEQARVILNVDFGKVFHRFFRFQAGSR